MSLLYRYHCRDQPVASAFLVDCLKVLDIVIAVLPNCQAANPQMACSVSSSPTADLWRVTCLQSDHKCFGRAGHTAE